MLYLPECKAHGLMCNSKAQCNIFLLKELMILGFDKITVELVSIIK